MRATDLADWDATDLSEAIAQRSVSCREVMTAFLDRIERTNPVVNAIVSLRDRDAAMADALAADEEIAAGRRRGVRRLRAKPRRWRGSGWR